MTSDVTDAGAIVRGNLTYLPVVPGRIEFALNVRRQILEQRPAVIAVELPSLLERHYAKAVDRMPKMSAILIDPEQEEQEGGATYIVLQPGDPFIEALRSARDVDATVVFIEPSTQERPHIAGAYPEPWAADLIGMRQYVESYRIHTRHGAEEELSSHAAAMAWKLQGADPLARTMVIVSLNVVDALLDAMQVPQEEPPTPKTRLFERGELFNLHPDCLAEITTEPPYFQERYEALRNEPFAPAALDRRRWQLALLREAENEYSVSTGEQIQSWQRIALAKFARNLAILDGHFSTGAYELALAARSIVDDNYGYEVWEMANRFSVQPTEDPPLETLNISGEEVWLRTRKLRLRRRLPRMKQRYKPFGLKSRKREKERGEWARQTDGVSICSYPPEDLIIEDYGRFLKNYAKNLVSEERSRVEPFTTSMRDGLDLRETIRKWHEGKLYVRELGRFSGDVGALVVIFDEDRQDRYRYLTTWLGEHQNESDMAFYSTEPFDHLVGPGIGRAEYGGLLMTLPPRRLYDVWGDHDYEAAETKAERLLMAALDYSVEQHVVYVAAKPPRSKFRQLASRVNRKIVYIPLGQLSPTKLKKIRVVHVLDGNERRPTAKEYIW